MDLSSQKMEYNEAMEEETEKINALTETLVIIGFEKDDLKTTNFNVRTAISICPAEPAMHIKFTIKDTTAVNEEMLRLAAANARSKAEVFCDAAGVKLGDLIDINYNWGELNVYSRTDYEDEYLAEQMLKANAIDFTPDDIDVSDTATFIWEIR